VSPPLRITSTALFTAANPFALDTEMGGVPRRGRRLCARLLHAYASRCLRTKRRIEGNDAYAGSSFS
jgi:hypothetical protein